MEHKYLFKEESLMRILQEGKWGKENSDGDESLCKQGWLPPATAGEEKTQWWFLVTIGIPDFDGEI